MKVTVTFPFVWDLAEQRSQVLEPDSSVAPTSNVSLICLLEDIQRTLRHVTDRVDIVVKPLELWKFFGK